MKLSCICLTYGRPAQLAEAVECFLRQQCDVPIELLIFNTCPQQQLRVETENPSVRVINCTVRPKSLGNARNLAIAQATGDWLVTWDDDDLYLPHYLQRFSDALKSNPQAQWLWQSHQFYSEGGKIRKTTSGTCNTFAFTREAWEAVGRYDETKNVGEDAALISRITASLPGTRCAPEPCDAGFIYCWGNGVYHVSGQGDDARQKLNSWRRAELAFLGRLRAGVAKAGQVSVRPAWRNDYQAAAREFLGANKIQPINPAGTAVVMLGRYGDIINALPICKHLHEQGRDPHLIVAREFADLLDGVSYVKAVPRNTPFDQLLSALEFAKRTFKDVLCCQIYGIGHKQEHLCQSYNMESWRVAGFLGKFYDAAWRPVFDRRDPALESALKRKLFKTTKPKIVTNLTSARTAPFPAGAKVLSAIQQEFGNEFEILDVGRMKLKRLYHLLPIFESAKLLVSIDTATLHLAAATDTPVIALINNSEWVGSTVRYNCVGQLKYHDATPEAVVKTIRRALSSKTHPALLRTPIAFQGERRRLGNVTLWACVWGDDAERQLRTLRVLRYCMGLFDFAEVVFFSHLPVPECGFPLRSIQVPNVGPSGWNLLHNRIIPLAIHTEFAMSVHDDGFPLDADLFRDEFLLYDFIGAPWADGVVGNGGFCIESQRFLKAKASLPFDNLTGYPGLLGVKSGSRTVTYSDVFTNRLHRQRLLAAGMKFAPVDVAVEFSTEQTGKQWPSFGFHGQRDQPVKYAAGWDKVLASEQHGKDNSLSLGMPGPQTLNVHNQ